MRWLAVLAVCVAGPVRADSLLGRSPPPQMALLEQADAVVEIEVTAGSADAGWSGGDKWGRARAVVREVVKGDLAAGTTIGVRHVIEKRGSTFCCMSLPRWRAGEKLRVALMREKREWRTFAWNAFQVGEAYVAVWKDPAAQLAGPLRHEALALMGRRGLLRRELVEPLLASADARDVGLGVGLVEDLADPALIPRVLEIATGARRLAFDEAYEVRAVVDRAWLTLIRRAAGDPAVVAALLWGQRTAELEEIAEGRAEELGLAIRAVPARAKIAAELIARAERDERPALLLALAPLDARAAYRLLVARYERNPMRMPLAIALLRRYATPWAARAALERGLPILDETLRLAPGKLPPGNPERAAARLIAAQEKQGPRWTRAPYARATRWTLGGRELDKRALIRLIDIAPDTPGLDAAAPARWLIDLDDDAQLWIADDGTFGFSWIPDRAWGRFTLAPF